MTTDIQRADPRLRRITVVVLVVATLAAALFVFALQRWMLQQVERLPTEQMIVELRHWIGMLLTGSGLCLLVLAGYAARLARRVIAERRWPLAGTRVLRDTPIRRDAAALRLARLLNLVAVALIALAIGVGVVSWRLFTAGYSAL
ncbi:hypothetical protein [Dokdonella soli]|uniref:Uncharacterized protein n=1 Tax=Dokdonella soli TaxID=529810 RepID=A0ABN1ICI6_9GAMM